MGLGHENVEDIDEILKEVELESQKKEANGAKLNKKGALKGKIQSELIKSFILYSSY